MLRCYIHRRAWWRNEFQETNYIIFFSLLKFQKDERNGQNQYKNKFFQNMKKYNCALLYGSSSRYVYDKYENDFNSNRITAIYQAREGF